MLCCPQELISIIDEMKTINLTPKQIEEITHTKPKYGYFINRILFRIGIYWIKLTDAIMWSDWYGWTYRIFHRK